VNVFKFYEWNKISIWDYTIMSYNSVFKTFFLLFFTSCIGNTSNTNQNITNSNRFDSSKEIIRDTSKRTFDTTLSIFHDSSYKLTLHVFDLTNDFDAEKNNAVLSFGKQEKNQTEILFIDSMFCMYPKHRFSGFQQRQDKRPISFLLYRRKS